MKFNKTADGKKYLPTFGSMTMSDLKKLRDILEVEKLKEKLSKITDEEKDDIRKK